MQIIKRERRGEGEREREMGGANDKRGHTETLWNELSLVRSSLVHGPSGESGELTTIDAWWRRVVGLGRDKSETENYRQE